MTTPAPTPTPASAQAACPRQLTAWMLAARPRTLPAAITPVVVGSALAARDQAFNPLPAVAALAGALLLQIGANLANDYFDFVKGADTAVRVGPPRATQQGWLTPSAVATAAGGVLTGAFLVGIYLVVVGGWPIVAIGLAGLACAVLYTGGPKPLGYLGLGDLTVFAFFGPAAVAGTYYVQALTVTPAVWLAAGPIGALVTAILVVNNLRDRHTDAAANKRTLAVRFGATAVRVEYTVLLTAAFAVLPVVPLLHLGGWGWLLPLLAAPLAIVSVRAIWRLDGSALNPHLGNTARLGLIFGALLAIGVFVP